MTVPNTERFVFQVVKVHRFRRKGPTAIRAGLLFVGVYKNRPRAASTTHAISALFLIFRTALFAITYKPPRLFTRKVPITVLVGEGNITFCTNPNQMQRSSAFFHIQRSGDN
jgi:hypothetical protein